METDMQIFTFLVISKALINDCVYNSNIKQARVKQYRIDKIGNEIYSLWVADREEEIWLMGYDYTNFGHLDGDIDNYFGAVVLDKDTILDIEKRFAQNQKRKTKWGITNDTKTYVRDAYRAKDKIDEMMLVEFVDLALGASNEFKDEEIESKAFILKNLNKKEKIRIGGKLSLFQKEKGTNEFYYHNLSDVVVGKLGYHMHKGHNFDYRKSSIQEFVDNDKIEARTEKEKSFGIIRGKLITNSLNDASHSMEDNVGLLTKAGPESASGVLVIDTIQELVNLHAHLTSDFYQEILK